MAAIVGSVTVATLYSQASYDRPDVQSEHSMPLRKHDFFRWLKRERTTSVLPLIVQDALASDSSVSRRIHAFSRAQRPEDALPRKVRSSMARTVDLFKSVPVPSADPGAILWEHSRRLASAGTQKRRGSERTLYGVPTEEGWVCYVVTGQPEVVKCVPDLIGGCYSIGIEIADKARRRVVVHGLLAENVRSVRVRVGESEAAATIGEGAFLAELDASHASELTVSVTLRGGEVRSQSFAIA
jgi:hypothetical protein